MTSAVLRDSLIAFLFRQGCWRWQDGCDQLSRIYYSSPQPYAWVMERANRRRKAYYCCTGRLPYL